MKITPWGYHKKLHFREKRIWVKQIFVKEGESTSLQSHEERDEQFFYVSGEGEIIIEDKKFDFNPFNKKQIICLRGEKHRIVGGKRGLTIIEVSEGNPKEKDIVRYEDKYGRK